MKQLVFATNNRHKLQELEHMFALSGLDFSLHSLSDLRIAGDIPEEFHTLEENSLAKARWVHERCRLNAFADDTGLEIDCLNGRPGVFSARYAGEGCSFDDNIRKVLEEMSKCGTRTARFRTVISLILNEREYSFEGIVEGEILHEKTGEGGFGYDPIFKPTGCSQSFAQMSPMLKNAISHRGRAFEKMVAFLNSCPG